MRQLTLNDRFPNFIPGLGPEPETGEDLRKQRGDGKARKKAKPVADGLIVQSMRASRSLAKRTARRSQIVGGAGGPLLLASSGDDESNGPRDKARSAGRPPVVEEDALDDLSNSVVDLVNAGRLDEALAASERLLQEFPDVVDGLERCAMVHAKMGNHALAADFYRRALAFVTDPLRGAHGQGLADFYREQMEKEERLAGLS